MHNAMIQLTCTKCQALLTVDDGFAGGVCRCKHCGTIQTVPAQIRRPPTPTGVGVPHAPDSPKTLFQVPSPSSPGASSLDELAQVIASSGLSGTGLTAERTRTPPPHAPRPNTTLLISTAAAALLLLAAVVAYLVTHPSNPTVDQTPTQTQKSPPHLANLPADPQLEPASSPQVSDPLSQLPAAKTPAFMGLSLSGPSVVYLLDRGSGTIETYDHLKLAAFNSVDSLGPNIKFQVIFWETDKTVAWPTDAVTYATQQNASACRNALADVYCFGQSRIEPALQKALAQNPAEIVVATGKIGLDDKFVSQVMAARKNSNAKIHTFCLGDTGSPDALKSLAQKTGGQFRQVSIPDLRLFAQ